MMKKNQSRLLKYLLSLLLVVMVFGMLQAPSTLGVSYVRLRNVATSLYMDGMGATGNGANVCQWGNSGSNNQQWIIVNSGSYVMIQNRATGLYLDGMGRTSNGSICGQWAYSASTNQQWTQETMGSNVRFKNRATGLYLDGMGSTANGANLCQWSNSSSNNQQWQIEGGGSSSTVKVMPLGDSITDGITVSGAYRTQLWKDIINNGLTVDFVGSLSGGPTELGDKNHEGHSGWRIDQIDANINAWMDAQTPKIVLLHIGTNDVNQNYNLANAPNRLSALIDKICAKLPAGGKLYVAKIIPESNYSLNQSVINYNNQIPGIVQNKLSQGKLVYMVDMYNAITTADLADGIHPNATGYNKMGDVWFNAIRADLR